MESFKSYNSFTIKERVFKVRTLDHIQSVKSYAKKIVREFPELNDLLKQSNDHDKSKFSNPEYERYVEITWYYNQLKRGNELVFNPDWNKATVHHVKTNSHHPEYHDPMAGSQSINNTDRDKPSGYIVDASEMPDIDIAEMCADWMSVSKEKNTNPIKWADDNIGTRWEFTDKQTDLIYRILNLIWV